MVQKELTNPWSALLPPLCPFSLQAAHSAYCQRELKKERSVTSSAPQQGGRGPAREQGGASNPTTDTEKHPQGSEKHLLCPGSLCSSLCKSSTTQHVFC